MQGSTKRRKSAASQPSSPCEYKASVLGFGYSDPLVIGAVLENAFGIRLMPVVHGEQGQCVTAALSGAELLRSLPQLDGKVVFVFDRPDNLIRLRGVKAVDFAFDGIVPRFVKFGVAALNPAKVPAPSKIELMSKPRDILREMLDDSDDGILNGILTFIYTIKNTKTRKDVTEIVYPWFFTQTQPDYLFKKLEAQFKNVNFAAMRALFVEKAELVAKIRTAVRAYSLRRHPDFRAFCEEQDIPFYDAHYLLKVVRGKKKPAKPQDK